MQMAPERLWFVVEDDEDRVFYERVLLALQSANTHFRIQGVHVLAGDGGGKTKMVAFFRYLRKRKSLRSQLSTNTTVIGFIFDKDLDDIERRMLRSDHTIYTDSYCHENHLFELGDLSLAAQQLPGSSLASSHHFRTKSNKEWLSSWATLILDWVALCIVVRRHGLSMGNFGVEHPLTHTPKDLQFDPNIYFQLCRSAARMLNIAEQDFTGRVAKARRQIEGKIGRGEHDSQFNGKWYFALMLREVSLLSGIPLKLDTEARTTIRVSLLSTLRESDWSRRLLAWARALSQMVS